MPKYLTYAKHPVLVFFSCLVTLAARADTLSLTKTFPGGERLLLQPWLQAWEDTCGHAGPAEVLQHEDRFHPVKALAYQKPTSVYWLKATLTGTEDHEWVLRFSNLTFVESFLYQQGKCTQHRRAGAFQPRSGMEEGNSRFHTLLPLQAGQTYTLLLRVHHTKNFRPFFDFSIQNERSFNREALATQQVDAWLQGAIGIFILYALLSWLVSRYGPYRWLLLFIGGVGMYGICSGPYFINWFFPGAPATGWLFNGPFLHMGMMGFYLLIIDFWDLRRQSPPLYRFGQLCMAVLVLVSVGGFATNLLTGNFNLINTVNLWAFIFPFSFVLVLLLRTYGWLNRAQKYLYYGLLLFLVGGIFVTLSSLFLREQALLRAPYITNATILAVFLVFATGLKEALRQHEKDKLAALRQLTHIQQHQNALLEQQVADRTGTLRLTNEKLETQKTLLVERNATIETLMNELNHRVKNNLQLLYSLGSLQLPGIEDEKTISILKTNMARVRAMMLVNQKLDFTQDERHVNLASLVAELGGHLQEIYDRSHTVQLHQTIGQEIELPSRFVLPLGLILTELYTNSFKYAFAEGGAPAITITAWLLADRFLHLTYTDNGTGFDPNQQKKGSMGLLLVHDLARQVKGTLTASGDGGAKYTLVFPLS